MHTSAAALELDFTEPSVTAAKAVAATIARNGTLQRETLLWAMEQAYGGSSADGHWSLRDAYDMLELAQVFHLEQAVLPAEPTACLAELVQLVANLPTHTVRSEEQIALQQFSTPAPIAYLACLAARVAATDLVLEPSAGTGLLAAFARRAGARLVLNELDPSRAEMLEAAFPGTTVTRHDAELIHDLLAPSIRPTAVLINPPFSRSVGRHADPLAAFRHLRAALMRLAPGGRCAAILPDRVDTSSRAWKKAVEGCGLTLHLLLPANAYAKHGTGQAVKIMVLEKGIPGDADIAVCETLVAALVQAIAVPAPSVPQPRPLHTGSPTLLGGLRPRPRLAAPIARPSVSIATRDIDYAVMEEPAPVGEAVGVYLPYRPSRIVIGCASEHPTALVESIAMGSITAPRPSFRPQLPARVVDDRVLSDELVRPTRSERMRQDLLLETMWEEASEEEFAALWSAEVDELGGKTRSSTIYLVAGLLLPVWDRLPDDHVQVWRLTTDDGQSFLGRLVPAPIVPKLAAAFGIAATIAISGEETAKHVLTTGEISTVGAYCLKRSLVAGQQRLELLDWPHTRLAELKAAGCFTEIIQHRTRLFVPVANAPAIIERITA